MLETSKAVEIFEKYGIKTQVDNNNMIIISHYSQPKGTTFKELGINEDELIENVIACEGKFETRKSALTKFPLIACREIRLDNETNIPEMPNLKAVGILLANKNLKKLPKLKSAGSISLENSIIKSLPKLKEVAIFIAQNSKLAELPALERAGKLCIVDCPLEELKNLEYAQEIFICSTDEKSKINITQLNKLEEVENLFVANSTLKSLPKLKKAKKIALYNCEIKSVKASLNAEIEIKNQITDEQLSEKFDSFTDWYNSEIFQNSMDLLGNIVNQIKGWFSPPKRGTKYY